MKIIKRNHQHINPDTLSEYLDGRIHGPALARIDQQLATCNLCREEIESLRSTITMLRELPQEAPRRSFVMTAPPPMLARPPTSAFQLPDFLRVPQWVYAGAASVAVIVVVALLSADASGLLSSNDVPGDAPRFQGQPTAVKQQAESLASESGPLTNVTRIEEQELTGTPGPPQLAAAAPAATAEPEESLAAAAVQAPPNQGFAGEALVEGETIEREITKGETTEEAGTERASAPIALSAEALPEQTVAEAVDSEPIQEPTGAAGVKGSSGPQGAAGAFEGDDASVDPEAPPSPQEEVEKIPAAAPVPTEVPTEVPQLQSKSTARAWRVLEGVAAFIGLISLIALGVRWRYSAR
jgi:anti-sigma factor RsiW